MTTEQVTVPRELLRQVLSDLSMYAQTDNGSFFDAATDAITAALEQPAVEALGWIKTSEQYPPEGVRVFWFQPQYNQVGYDAWMGGDYAFTAEYWMHIPSIGATPQPQQEKS